jgi:DNA-binding HxlR family transcriptional regulator
MATATKNPEAPGAAGGTAADLYGCPVARTAQIIGNKWTPLIVRDLARGARRFSQLQRSLVGISPKTLTERLKYLEAVAVIERRCYAEVPPRVVYSLTEKGRALLPVIESMRAYGVAWLKRDCDEAALGDAYAALAGAPNRPD